MKTFCPKNLDQWQQWLADHHDSESEVWLIFHKQHTEVASIDYKDALDEALCFGWVDSLVKRLDDRRYARKFTPRRADSRWSTINRKTLRGTQSQWEIEADRDRSSPDGPRLWFAPDTVQIALEASRQHTDGIEETSPSIASL